MSSTPPAERALVRAAQRGSADALDRLFRKYWTRAYRAAYLIVHDADAASAPPDPPGLAPSDEVVRALATRAPERRAVVVLRYLLDYTPGEISTILELPRGTVNSRLRRGLDELEPLLGGSE